MGRARPKGALEVTNSIQVRLRHELSPSAEVLGEVPLFDVDKVIPLITKWGVSYDGTTYEDVFGQFVLDDDGHFAYFEVVLAE